MKNDSKGPIEVLLLWVDLWLSQMFIYLTYLDKFELYCAAV